MYISRLESIGAYMPSTEKSTSEIIQEMKNPPQFDLEEITGIKSRRVRSEEEDSLVLAIKAVEKCLQNSKYKPEEIDVVISTSITRFITQSKKYFEPAFSLFIKNKLGMHQAINFDMSNACAGMFSGVYALDALIRSGAVKNGIVVSGECITPIADTAVEEISEPLDQQFGSLTVGDSGAAVLLDKALDDKNMIEYIEMMTCAEYAHLCIGMPSVQANRPALYTKNEQMHKSNRLQMWPKFQMDVLNKMGKEFKNEKFDYIVQHQVGTKFIRKVNKVGEEVFGMEMPETLVEVDRFGNTSSTAHFVVLYHYLKENKIKKNAKILFVPAASGLVTGCLSLKINNLKVD